MSSWFDSFSFPPHFYFRKFLNPFCFGVQFELWTFFRFYMNLSVSIVDVLNKITTRRKNFFCIENIPADIFRYKLMKSRIFNVILLTSIL